MLDQFEDTKSVCWTPGTSSYITAILPTSVWLSLAALSVT